MSQKTSRTLFYIFLILSFLTGVFFKQFNIWEEKPFLLIAFCGTIGLLWDYTWRIRHTWWALVPLLTSLEFMGDLLKAAGLDPFAFVVYLVSAMVFPVFGVLFVSKGVEIWKEDKGPAWRFILLGLGASSLLSWEVATYFPGQIDSSHIAFRVMFLAVFALQLFVDFTVNFHKRPHLKVQGQILHLSLLIMAVWYFVRFVFK